ncbi:MAG: response regulator [Bacteroidota bacterium]
MYHKALEKQISKFLTSEHLGDQNIIAFLDAVSKYYNTFERDKKLSEHAFEVSEREYQKVVLDLKKQDDINKQSILKIKQLIRSLDSGNTNIKDGVDEVDIILILGFLEKQVERSKILEEALIKAKELAENSAEAKSNFLSTMSHEIRTPLNGVIGFTDLLMKTKLDSTQHQYMSAVFQSANSLLDIVNDILDFSKIDAGKLELESEKIDLLEVGNQVADIISYQAHQKKLEVLLNIAPNVPRFVWADAVRLRQILVNLLSNAVKFTEVGEIELKVSVLSKDADGATVLCFSVRDTGIGILEKNKQKIFEAFAQEDASTTRKYGGTGLGLAISNKLLALMNSKLLLKSEIGKGSTFYFDVSFKALEGSEPNLQNFDHIKQVLIVDDNTNNRLILKDMLALKKINADLAEDGIKAVEMIGAGNCYDVILMDYNMPEMNGIETIRQIRTNANIGINKQPIILLYSSSDDELINEACKELEVQQRLVKPIKMQQLFNALAKLNANNLVVEESKETESAPIINESQNLKILIADDNSVNMFLAKIIVSGVLPNATIYEAINGKEAIDVFEREQPHLILMDVQMPEVNGYEAATAIRGLEKAGRIPIIALTAGTVKGEKDRCLQAGMDDYISKPVVKANIEAVIERWLKANDSSLKSEKSNTPSNEAITTHFNRQDLLKNLGGDTQIVSSFIEIIKSSFDEILKDLRDGLAQNNLEKITTTAHKLKGVALSGCLPKLVQHAATLEYQNNFDRYIISNLIEHIEKEVNYIKQIIA